MIKTRTVVMLVLLAWGGSGVLNFELGRWYGHGERQKWDADWYAAHPTVFETDIAACHAPYVGSYQIRKSDGATLFVCDTPDGKSTETMIHAPAPLAPKPKGSKRHKADSNYMVWDDYGQPLNSKPTQLIPEPTGDPVRIVSAGGDPDYLRDVPAKEMTQVIAWEMKNCDSNACEMHESKPVHLGWTCEDKRRIVLESEDGKFHCILPPGQSVAAPHPSEKPE